MLTIEQVQVSYGSLTAVHGVTFGADPGDIVGILGPNGAGKTTILRAIMGLVPAYAGRIVVGGWDPASEPIKVKRSIGYVPEEPRLYECLSPNEYLHFVAALYGLPQGVATARTSQLLKLYNLSKDATRPLGELSKGTRQKVTLAAAYIHRPSILVLDEPFDGLDISSIIQTREILIASASSGGVVLLSSHHVESVERLCTRVVILNAGRLMCTGPIADVCLATGTESLEEAYRQLTGAGEMSGGDLWEALR